MGKKSESHVVGNEDQLYAQALIAKQCGCDDVEATKKLAGLEAHEVADLVAHGRAGQVEQCRKMLGIA